MKNAFRGFGSSVCRGSITPDTDETNPKLIQKCPESTPHLTRSRLQVILPIFSPENEGSDGESTWTEGVENVADRLYAQHCDRDNVCSQKQYRGCYAAGRACPLDHTVRAIPVHESARWKTEGKVH